MNRLPVAPAYTLAERAEEQRWLVDGLWSEEAVGIIGREPKCCKSFLALDLAVSVASGTPCLRRFAVTRPEACCSMPPRIAPLSCAKGSKAFVPPQVSHSKSSISR